MKSVRVSISDLSKTQYKILGQRNTTNLSNVFKKHPEILIYGHIGKYMIGERQNFGDILSNICWDKTIVFVTTFLLKLKSIKLDMFWKGNV